MNDDGMLYLRFRDGSIRGISSTPQEGAGQRVPDGAEVITRELYVTLAAEARAAIERRRGELRAADAVRQEADFRALSDAGLPAALASRLSGHTGPASDGSGHSVEGARR